MPIKAKFPYPVQDKPAIAMQEWIDYEHSLTDKLSAIKGGVCLTVLSQKWIAPKWWDRYFLLINNASVLQREILMSNSGINYWFARTLIPQKCYDLNPAFFDRLSHVSMRDLIFNEETVQRIGMKTYPIDTNTLEFAWIRTYCAEKEILWLRLAEYSLQQTESFYVIEILFPELEYVN